MLAYAQSVHAVRAVHAVQPDAAAGADLVARVRRALAPRRLGALGRALADAVLAPSVPHFSALEGALLDLSTPEDLVAMGRRFREAPEVAPLYATREDVVYRLQDVAACPPGSLGEAWRRFMLDHQLSTDYLPQREQESDLGWFRARTGQAHDQWHALLGIAPDVRGEVEIIAFQLGQLRRSLPREPLAQVFTATMIFAYLVDTARRRPRELLACLRAVPRGLRRGLATPGLWGVRWERLWSRPLSSVRTELGVAP